MDKEILWNIFLVVSVILVINGMQNVNDTDKKTAQAAQSETAIGAGGIAAFVMKKTFVFTWPILAVIALGPFIFTQWKNLFFPPAVPSWIWLVVIGMVFILLLNMNKRNK